MLAHIVSNEKFAIIFIYFPLRETLSPSDYSEDSNTDLSGNVIMVRFDVGFLLPVLGVL